MPPIPHIGFSAPSGTGKTTLIARLAPLLQACGLRLGYLKHAHHGFDLDTPGKDSYLLREAGASTVLIASAQRWALLQEGRADGLPEDRLNTVADGSPPALAATPGLAALLARFDPATTDLVLIEGWHGASFPRIAIHRPSSGREHWHLDDPDVIAVATDAPEQLPASLKQPLLPLADLQQIADFILSHPRIGLSGAATPRPVTETPVPKDPREQLVFYYRLLRQHGYNDAQSGNASVRTADGFVITPTGAGGDDLCAADLVTCSLQELPPEGASFDSRLHQLVYASQTEAQAILHSHGPYSIAASFTGDDFRPVDFEGKHYFSQVPIVPIPSRFEDYLREVPERVASALSQSPIAMIASHGVYAWGHGLRDAYRWTCALEHSATIKHLLSSRTNGADHREPHGHRTAPSLEVVDHDAVSTMPHGLCDHLGFAGS